MELGGLAISLIAGIIPAELAKEIHIYLGQHGLSEARGLQRYSSKGHFGELIWWKKNYLK